MEINVRGTSSGYATVSIGCDSVAIDLGLLNKEEATELAMKLQRAAIELLESVAK